MSQVNCACGVCELWEGETWGGRAGRLHVEGSHLHMLMNVCLHMGVMTSQDLDFPLINVTSPPDNYGGTATRQVF